MHHRDHSLEWVNEYAVRTYTMPDSGLTYSEDCDQIEQTTHRRLLCDARTTAAVRYENSRPYILVAADRDSWSNHNE